MAVHWIDGQGARVAGRGRRADVRAEVAAHLRTKRGMDDVDAEDAAEDAQVVRAWWGGDDVGFVNADHPGAEPVTVLNIPGPPSSGGRGGGRGGDERVSDVGVARPALPIGPVGGRPEDPGR